MSAAEIVAALFFAEMRFDPHDPQHPQADRFVLSKGHAAPILYAAWAAAGAFPRDEVLKLRRIDSDLEGHPTPRLPFVDVATGSLGQGLAAGLGIALNARRIGSDYRTYVLLGDGESAEGAVWEAAQVAAHHRLDNVCAITDVNGLGQSAETQWDHDTDAYVTRWRAFGWHALAVDGHDLGAILAALAEARAHHGQADDDRGAHAQGKGRQARRGQGRLARQAAQEGAREPIRRSPSSKRRSSTTTDPAPVIPQAGGATDRRPAARLRRDGAGARLQARRQRGDA